MTGFESKRQMAQAKVRDDADTQVYEVYADTLLIVYQRGFADGKKVAQRPWVGLTDEEIDSCWYQSGGVTPGFARTVEAKLKEKNDH